LRTELAFYIGALNLRDRLAAIGAPFTMPEPAPPGSRRLRFQGLYDTALALTLGHRPVGNSVDADGKRLVVLTGANQGGKSSWLRAVGLAQLMMHCGMFVGAEAFTSARHTALFTHCKREEDATMQRGKLDEELYRLSDIVDVITPHAIVMFNESFAATNEHEGSGIATEVVTALLERGMTVLFVTHLYEFAHGMFDRMPEGALFLRAERLPDGTRTFHLLPGEPLETSYGADLYRQAFANTG
jgi:DNA mismatch repair ATPase MutS